MREILFKAKQLSDGEWVEGSYVYANNRLNVGKSYILPGMSDELDVLSRLPPPRSASTPE